MFCWAAAKRYLLTLCSQRTLVRCSNGVVVAWEIGLTITLCQARISNPVVGAIPCGRPGQVQDLPLPTHLKRTYLNHLTMLN